MKHLIFIFLSFVSLLSFAQECPIIPQPNHVTAGKGAFILNNSTAIVVEKPALERLANHLQTEILKATGLTLSLQPTADSRYIKLVKSSEVINSSEQYSLKVTPSSVVITAQTDEGLFYGVISLIQLVQSGTQKNDMITIGCWDIQEAPRYSWRGLMLDESRHFFGIKTVKNILDWMAFYKLNRFHWHLTDAPGWRIQIKSYPQLTLVGGIGTYSNPLAPAAYYSQEDIKEIVSYAKERYITVIPEIDMPGHATAANKAYPEFSGGGSEKHPDFTFNPGKESTYNYLSKILKEVDVLFPSQMIHLGGDEVSFGNEKWSSDLSVKQMMKEHGLKDVGSVEDYFIRRMADTVFSLSNKTLLWDEAAGMNLPKDKTIICWWRHDKTSQLRKALDNEFSTVICPRLPFYFDFVQDTIQKVGRKWNGQFNSLRNVYTFSLSQLPITETQKKLILGVQAALWTEHISTKEKLEYMLYPRICALAENAWTEDKNRSYERFLINIKSQLDLYKRSGIYYYNPFNPSSTPEPLTSEEL